MVVNTLVPFEKVFDSKTYETVKHTRTCMKDTVVFKLEDKHNTFVKHNKKIQLVNLRCVSYVDSFNQNQ